MDFSFHGHRPYSPTVGRGNRLIALSFECWYFEMKNDHWFVSIDGKGKSIRLCCKVLTVGEVVFSPYRVYVLFTQTASDEVIKLKCKDCKQTSIFCRSVFHHCYRHPAIMHWNETLRNQYIRARGSHVINYISTSSSNTETSPSSPLRPTLTQHLMFFHKGVFTEGLPHPHLCTGSQRRT